MKIMIRDTVILIVRKKCVHIPNYIPEDNKNKTPVLKDIML